MWKLFRLCCHCGRWIRSVYQDRNAGESQVKSDRINSIGNNNFIWKLHYTASSKSLIAIFRIDNAEVDLITNTGGLSSELVVKLTLLIILTCQVEQESEDEPARKWKREPNWLLAILSSLLKVEMNLELWNCLTKRRSLLFVLQLLTNSCTTGNSV